MLTFEKRCFVLDFGCRPEGEGFDMPELHISYIEGAVLILFGRHAPMIGWRACPVRLSRAFGSLPSSPRFLCCFCKVFSHGGLQGVPPGPVGGLLVGRWTVCGRKQRPLA